MSARHAITLYAREFPRLGDPVATVHLIRSSAVTAAATMVLAFTMFCFGCRTRPPASPPRQAAAFSSEEILSRKWTNANGRLVQLLQCSTGTSKNLGEFLIAKFGDRDLNEAQCCEFYLVKRVPSRLYTDTTKQELPVRVMPEYTVNYLLARLNSPDGIIGAIDMKEKNDSVVFSFDQKVKHQYSIKTSNDLHGEPQKVAVPWHGGILWQLTFTGNYEPQWASKFYESASSVVKGVVGEK